MSQTTKKVKNKKKSDKLKMHDHQIARCSETELEVEYIIFIFIRLFVFGYKSRCEKFAAMQNVFPYYERMHQLNYL